MKNKHDAGGDRSSLEALPIAVDTASVLAAVQGRLNQRSLGGALASLVDAIEKQDADVRVYVASLEARVAGLVLRVESLEASAHEREKKTKGG